MEESTQARTFTEVEAENIRLVIWDLDDTFWTGTLSEAPVTWIASNGALVIELARRGIVSSICSKNDLEAARAVLEAEGLWDHFVFPSIDYDPKGPRIKALVEAVQLRPETVLFIDDNPSNLEEARHCVPGLQVARHLDIPGLDADPRLEGRPDPDLVRLGQYRSLQRRRTDAASRGGDVADFLRASDIRVSIEHDVLSHADRAIELINRTNQLNFTKNRLPEDTAAAREDLATLLGQHDVQAALLRVTDRYGDHGFAGLYVVNSSQRRLDHFCFSCRILGMGVETWLYRKLGRPRLEVTGPVLSDPVADDRTIDWIALADKAAPAGAASGHPRTFDRVAARGGCDMATLSHYFGLAADDVVGEFNVGRFGFDARVDHSVFLRYAVEGFAPEWVPEVEKLGYRAEDFRSAYAEPADGKTLWLLSFWIDSIYALYRHRRFGFVVPFARPGEADHGRDARLAAVEDLPPHHRADGVAAALRTLQADYDYLGLIDEDGFKDNLRRILSAAPRSCTVVMLKRTAFVETPEGERHVSAAAQNLNRWLDDLVGEYPQVRIADIGDFIRPGEASEWLHFDRMVYHRLFEGVMALLSNAGPGRGSEGR